MEMFLMAAVMSLLGLAVCAALFAAATREEHIEASRPAEKPSLGARRFFAAAPVAASSSEPLAADAEPTLVPVEALMLQIEEHIRLEQAAAESFLHTPTEQSLHSRTASRLVN
jgi:hypothetical protein